LSSLPQNGLITLITVMILITLITQMKVFQHTGPRQMNLILQSLLYSTSQRREIFSFKAKTYKALKIIELITVMQ